MKRMTFEKLMRQVEMCSHGASCTDCCWVWKGSTDRWGYGKTRWNNAYAIPHRVVFQVMTQCELTKEQLVLHTCDNPPCCNWYHLYIGDHVQNAKDKVDRGRMNLSSFVFQKYVHRGIGQSQAKLTEEKVREMRKLYKTGEYSQVQLAAMFNVGKSVVQRIVTYQDWSHIV